MNDAQRTVICFGEILWDFLPAGLFPGGAPFNVAYHLKQLGLEPHLVSAVCRDRLGEELVRRLRHWGLRLDGLTWHTGLPTGYVTATVGTDGNASYDIATGVAWDQIVVTPDTLQAATTADAIIFGSLAQRSPQNRAALDRLLAVIPPAALRVFDVNLRPPFDDLGLVRDLASRATILKLNDDEAARLCGSQEPPAGHEEDLARDLAARFGNAAVVITCGARGAGLWRGERWLWVPGQPIQVKDTVGAGDSFVAALLSGLLAGHDDAVILAQACRIGEWVASHDGATPAYDDSTPRPMDPVRQHEMFGPPPRH